MYGFHVDYITNHFIPLELCQEVQSLHPSISSALLGHNPVLMGRIERIAAANTPFCLFASVIWLTSPEPLRFTHFFAVKKGKWELIWNKLLFFFTLLTGNPLRNTERVSDQCFRGQLSLEHVNVWSAALGEQH